MAGDETDTPNRNADGTAVNGVSHGNDSVGTPDDPVVEIKLLRAYLLKRTAAYATALLCVWWAFMGRSYPFIAFGYVIGVLGGMIRMTMHAGHLGGWVIATRRKINAPGGNSEQDEESGILAGGALKRYAVAVLAVFAAAAASRGNIWVIATAGLGLAIPTITIIVEGARGRLDADSLRQTSGDTNTTRPTR